MAKYRRNEDSDGVDALFSFPTTFPVEKLGLLGNIRMVRQPEALETFAMKRMEFTCDGCDLVEHLVLPTQDEVNFMVDGWVAYNMVVRESDGEPYEISTDLYPKCAVKMRHAANPAHWPRASKALSNDDERRAVG